MNTKDGEYNPKRLRLQRISFSEGSHQAQGLQVRQLKPIFLRRVSHSSSATKLGIKPEMVKVEQVVLSPFKSDAVPRKDLTFMFNRQLINKKLQKPLFQDPLSKDVNAAESVKNAVKIAAKNVFGSGFTEPPRVDSTVDNFENTSIDTRQNFQPPKNTSLSRRTEMFKRICSINSSSIGTPQRRSNLKGKNSELDLTGSMTPSNSQKKKVSFHKRAVICLFSKD